jgi:hypothetical protein
LRCGAGLHFWHSAEHGLDLALIAADA